MAKRRVILTFLCCFLIATLVSFILLPAKHVVPVLWYHSIDEYSQVSKLSVAPESFERQMIFLKRRGYNVVGLDELIDSIKAKKKLPSRTVAITFDDGYENNFTVAYPILKKYGFPATIFVVTDWVGRAGYISWDQIKRMADNGIDIGAHTKTHPCLTDLDRSRAWDEISGSKRTIEAMIGHEVKFFCYPFGAFNEEAKRMVQEAGYVGACATNPGKLAPKDDIYALKRIRISRTSDNLFTFWIESSGYYTWVKEVRDED